jgi:hypothetical protein
MVKRHGPWAFVLGMALLCSQKIYLLFSTPWANDDDHTWGAIYLAIIVFFLVAMLYFWFRDGTAALQDRLGKSGEAINRAISKSPFGGPPQ